MIAIRCSSRCRMEESATPHGPFSNMVARDRKFTLTVEGLNGSTMDLVGGARTAAAEQVAIGPDQTREARLLLFSGDAPSAAIPRRLSTPEGRGRCKTVATANRIFSERPRIERPTVIPARTGGQEGRGRLSPDGPAWAADARHVLRLGGGRQLRHDPIRAVDVPRRGGGQALRAGRPTTRK